LGGELWEINERTALENVEDPEEVGGKLRDPHKQTQLLPPETNFATKKSTREPATPNEKGTRDRNLQ
jgi:hypothetical protein